MPTTEASYTPREIRWGGCESRNIRFGLTVASGQGALPEGTILGKIASSGKFGKYDSTASNGLEVALAVLADSIDATSVDVDTSGYVAGVFRETELGAELDAGAKNNLNARSYWNGAIILGGGGAW